MAKSKKAAAGAGTIRKKTVTRAGKQYTYWEARLTTGRDPGTGRQVQRSFTGKTQKEVREKLQAAAVAVNTGTYTAPQKLTVGQWLDTWAADYLGGVKPATRTIYQGNIRNHLKPALGAVRLCDLRPHMVQQFINGLELSPASVRLAYKVLYQALEKAAALEYIPKNPAAGCQLPRLEQREIRPHDDAQAAAILEAVRGGPLERLVPIALYTGCRISELLGLTWGSVDFQRGTITIDKQLARPEFRARGLFLSPKNGKSRTITPARSVLELLKKERRYQAQRQLRAGPLWSNPDGLVFTMDDGSPMDQWRADKAFRAAAESVGLERARLHDLRHTFATLALQNGVDIKTLSGILGHYSSGFTLDTYTHITDKMQQEAAEKMGSFMEMTF